MAAKYRDLITTVKLLEQKQRMDAAEGDDADVISYHYENHLLAVNLFHMRGGKMLDRREFFWEELSETAGGAGFQVGEFFSPAATALPGSAVHSAHHLVPVEFEDRTTLEEVLSEGQKRHVQIHVPQRGEKRSLIDLVGRTRSSPTSSASG